MTDTPNRRRYTLRELLDQCDPTALPVPEIDFGPPVGAEFGSPDFEEKLLEPKGRVPRGTLFELKGDDE